jgi:hypothetical protein
VELYPAERLFYIALLEKSKAVFNGYETGTIQYTALHCHILLIMAVY